MRWLKIVSSCDDSPLQCRNETAEESEWEREKEKKFEEVQGVQQEEKNKFPDTTGKLETKLSRTHAGMFDRGETQAHRRRLWKCILPVFCCALLPPFEMSDKNESEEILLKFFSREKRELCMCVSERWGKCQVVGGKLLTFSCPVKLVLRKIFWLLTKSLVKPF